MRTVPPWHLPDERSAHACEGLRTGSGAGLFEIDAMRNVVRAHVDLGIGVVLGHGPPRPVVGARRVERDDRAARARRVEVAQHLRRARIAKVHRQIRRLARGHAVAAHVERHEGDEALGEELRDGLADAAEAEDDDVVVQLRRLCVRRHRRRLVLGLEHLAQLATGVLQGGRSCDEAHFEDMRGWQPEGRAAGAHSEVGRDGHGEHDHEDDGRDLARGEQPLLDGLGEHDECKLAAGRDVEARARRRQRREAAGLADEHHDAELAEDEREQRAQHGGPVGEEHRELHVHADGHEEEAHEQALERLDVALHLRTRGLASRKRRHAHNVHL